MWTKTTYKKKFWEVYNFGKQIRDIPYKVDLWVIESQELEIVIS